MVLLNDVKEIEKAFVLCHNEMRQYKRDYFKMWLMVILGILLGFVVSPLTFKAVELLGMGAFDRSGLDTLVHDFLGELDWDDIIVDDLLVTTFEYNSKQPRFVNKYFVENDPGLYSYKLKDAVAASSSVPGGFDPKTYVNMYNITERLIDGMVMCNSPALYAYEIAVNLRDKNEGVRMLSLGTGAD